MDIYIQQQIVTYARHSILSSGLQEVSHRYYKDCGETRNCNVSSCGSVIIHSLGTYASNY